jgi:hypothetical protein
MVGKLSEDLGVRLEKRRFPLPEGGRLEVDGVSDSPPMLVEAWAHQGPPKSAQKHKVMTDAIKLLYAARFLTERPRLILLFADHAAAEHFRGRTWMGQLLKGAGATLLGSVVGPLGGREGEARWNS